MPGPAERKIIADRATRLGLELRQIPTGPWAGDWQLVRRNGSGVQFGWDQGRTWDEVIAWLDKHDPAL
ncbi:MAG: hypothetical protein J0M16_00445 [Gammaproteobacteria bacterium]|nr:hypothetical protein [Gammaproteobacteria bacterium]